MLRLRGSSLIFHRYGGSCTDWSQYSHLKITVQKYKYLQTGVLLCNVTEDWKYFTR